MSKMLINFIILFANIWSLIVLAHAASQNDEELEKFCLKLRAESDLVMKDDYFVYLCTDGNNNTVELATANGTLHIRCHCQERVHSFTKEMWNNFLENVHNLSSQSNIETINITSCHVMDEGIKNLLSQSWARKVTTLYISNYTNETITFPED